MQGIVAPTGARATVTYQRGVPPVVNTARSTGVITHAATLVLGKENVLADAAESRWRGLRVVSPERHRRGRCSGSACGRRAGAQPDLDLHQGAFDVDEAAIDVGVKVLTRSVLDALDVD